MGDAVRIAGVAGVADDEVPEVADIMLARARVPDRLVGTVRQLPHVRLPAGETTTTVIIVNKISEM